MSKPVGDRHYQDRVRTRNQRRVFKLPASCWFPGSPPHRQQQALTQTVGQIQCYKQLFWSLSFRRFISLRYRDATAYLYRVILILMIHTHAHTPHTHITHMLSRTRMHARTHARTRMHAVYLGGRLPCQKNLRCSCNIISPAIETSHIDWLVAHLTLQGSAPLFFSRLQS